MVALVATLAERRRNKRHDIDEVGFMPWQAIVVLAMLTGLIAAALAMRGL